jgi:hypothetical protein
VATLPFGETSAIQCNWASHRYGRQRASLPAGLVFPFTSFQGISFILRLPFGVYTIGSYQDLNPAKVAFVAFSLAGMGIRIT